MKIELWCDIICPFCGLNEHRLENALAEFEHGADVQVLHRSFQVHPELDRVGVTQRDLILMRGLDPEKVEKNILEPIEQAAKREGLVPYRVIDRTLGPTDYAHELLAYASDNGLHSESWKHIFRAHFGTAQRLWTIDEVIDFAAELDLDLLETRLVLQSGRYREQVKNDQREAQRLGANGTPFMLIDRKHPVSTALNTDELLSILRSAWRDLRIQPLI
jgi:predicted DsbA family dithiol-disulfide isomerase